MIEDAIAVDRTVDCKGLSCPMPIVKSKKAIEDLRPGEVLEILATDPGSVADVKNWAVRVGHQFIGTVSEGSVYRHYVRRAVPSETRPELVFPDRITNEELGSRLGDDIVIVDVREPAEFAFGHIPGATSVPLGTLAEDPAFGEDLRDRDVYVICRSGHRSETACHMLKKRGFERIHNVVPGMHVWQGPLETGIRQSERG